MLCVCLKGKFKANLIFAYSYVLPAQLTLNTLSFQSSLIRTSKDILAHAVLSHFFRTHIMIQTKKPNAEIEFEVLVNLWCIINVTYHGLHPPDGT